MNFVRSCQPKLAAAAFVFVHPKLRPVTGARSRALSQGWMMPESETRVLEPSHGPELGPPGQKCSWGNDEKRRGREAEYSWQSPALSMSPCILFSVHQPKSRPKTRFKPSLRVPENAKFHVLNLANVHRKLLSI